MASGKGVEWQNLSTPGICPGLTFGGKPNLEQYNSCNSVSASAGLCIRRQKWFINLNDTTQSLPLLICISTGADHYNK